MKFDADSSDRRHKGLYAVANHLSVDPPSQPLPTSAGGDCGAASEEIAEAARFPAENPNPVFRVSEDGKLMYANRASRPLLTAWQVAADGSLPPEWQERLAGVLASGEARKWDALCDDRVLQLHCIPIRDGGYVNVYASDVTERVALVAHLVDEQRRLREQVGLTEQLLELLPAGIGISYDPECKDIRVNPALARMLAVNRDANVSLGADEDRREAQYRVFDQAGRELIVDELPMQAAAARGTEVRDQVIDILREDGVKLTLLSYAVPLFDAAGKRRGAIGAYVDISALRAVEVEREQLLSTLAERSRELELLNEDIRELNAGLEQRVQERTAELEAIFASVPDALYVSDRDGIVRANRAALETFGVESVEELNRSAASLAESMLARSAGTRQLIPPQELVITCALRGERVIRETISRNLKTNEERVHRSAAAPIVVKGEIVGAVGIATDITEPKRVQAQIAYQANLLANVNDAIMAYDAHLHITAWNRRAEEQYGWKAEEVIGAYAPAVVGSRMTDDERAAALRTLEKSGRWQGEVRHTRRDGTPIIVEVTNMALRDAAGCIETYVTVNRDITQRKETEAQNVRLLEEIRASREQLRTLSHRLVTMQESERSYVADQLYNEAGQVLAALQFQLSLLGKEGGHHSPNELLPEMRATLNEAIHKLHDLARQLRPVGLDRSTLARVLESHVTEFCRMHDIAVQFRPGENEMLRLPADVGTALFRAVQEGLTNVARHAAATEVFLSMSQEAGKLVVSLADDGHGFDPCDGYSRGNAGLASIRERLETVGGQFMIASGNAGTTLRFEVPLNEEEP